ncbi:tachykinin-3b [Micropterus salmoides]|uniref:tachykinin-3b n=1 Tax=Micropterus salmoides TaxID=27706 RepID=UPI0018EABAFF|nr:tachykinin-3b [Micropterus salmoides]
MERTPNCCAITSLIALAILVLFPVRSWCEEDTYKLPAQANKPECCVNGAAQLHKRFDDIDYDSFVSLMGRRSAAHAKRDMDHIFTALLGRRTRIVCPCAKEYFNREKEAN